MARICLITPGHLSTNPRIVKEADALSDAGHEVRVIAADFAEWARVMDNEFDDRPWRLEERFKFGPDAPFFTRLRRSGRQRIARCCAKLWSRSEAIDCAACHPIAPDLVEAARRTPADLYIAHYVAALPAAARAAESNGGLYAFDAEDFHLGDLPDDPQHNFEKRIIAAIEGRYLAGCLYVTAASPGIADAYAEMYGIRRPTVVLNVFPQSQAAEFPTARGAASPNPSVYWFSQTIGENRGLESAIQAIGRAKSKPHLYLRGNISREFRERLAWVEKSACADGRVHILPPAPPAQMVQLASAFDIGLVSETGETHNRRIALTNKQFTYLVAGIPVLMSDVPGHRMFAEGLSDAIQLYPVDDADALAEAMDAWLMNDISLASARRVAWELGNKRFNWDVEHHQLLKLSSNLTRLRRTM